MTKRTLIIILSAVAFALLVGFIWFTFFRSVQLPPANNGSFGTGTAKPGGTTGTAGGQNNIPSGVLPVGSNTNTGASVSGGSGGGTGGVYGASGGVAGISSVPGVDWLGGSNPAGGGGPTSNFVPKTVNELNSGNVSGNPNILPGSNVESGSDNGFLGTALLGAGLGTALCTAGLLGGGAVSLAGNAAEAVTAVPVSPRYLNTVATSDTVRENFLNCIARTIARAAIQQITASVVNWINSGFNGQPSFVRNYQQFFTNVADQAAGEFIRGSSLSFLCSPFRNQIRTAVAQSYARRNAQSCTLSGVIKNINGFTSGNFSQGGWQGLLAYTGIPTNNPFGAYSYAQSGLANAQSQAVGQKQQDYVVGKGFLSSEKEVNCRVVAGAKKCDKVTVTPGSTIADSLNKTLGVGQDSLNMAKSFDEIISALITQLMVKTLQGGLSNLSGTNGYAANYLTPEQQQAQANAQTLLTDMQGRVNLAQQYGSTQQGSIQDIQNTQSQLQGLVNCWESKNQNELATSSRIALHSYDAQVDAYNANITRANEGIAALQDLQTRAIGVTSAGDVAAVSAAYQSALASGVIITQLDITNAQQDRATLQSALATRNQQTAAELQQCYAFE